MKKLLLISILIATIVSCRQLDEKNEVEPKLEIDDTKYEMIQIQFGPSFISPSLLNFNLNNRKILFQRIGMSRKLEVEPLEEGGNVIEVFSPKSSYYLIDSLAFRFITDSILYKFNEQDFKNMNLDCDDGIWTSIVITDIQNNVKDFELSNNGTEKQYKLILKLLEICIGQETDSLNLKYLKELKEYY